MRDYITIGSSPSDEDCAQVGSETYLRDSRIECRAFIEQIVEAYGMPPDKARVHIKSFPHDFGTYREVVVSYDDENEAEATYAYDVEADAFGRLRVWTPEAKARIAEMLAQAKQADETLEHLVETLPGIIAAELNASDRR